MRIVGGQTRRRTRVARLLLAMGIVSVVVTWALIRRLPVVGFDAPTSTVVYDRQGWLIGGTVARDGQWRLGVPAHVPERYRRALLRYEDRRFPWHIGVDPLAAVRALSGNWISGRVKSGASTLTMQVVRLALGPGRRTWSRKLQEAALAMRMEMSLSKTEILQLYAAHAPFGGNTVGIEAAAWRYFRRPPAELTWAEAAVLAVLPNNPAIVHPTRNRDTLRSKRNGLLKDLAEQGHIDPKPNLGVGRTPAPSPRTPTQLGAAFGPFVAV